MLSGDGNGISEGKTEGPLNEMTTQDHRDRPPRPGVYGRCNLGQRFITDASHRAITSLTVIG
jgi:hypothetical protein